MNHRVITWLLGLLLTSAFNVFAQTTPIQVVQTMSTASVLPGGTVTYQIQVINTGPDDANAVQLHGDLHPQLSFISLSQTAGPAASCTTPSVGSAGAMDCVVALLSSGSTLEFDLVVQVSGGATPGSYISNTFSIPSGSSDDENNTATANLYVLQVPLADVGVTLTGSPSGAPGSTVNYQIQLFNAGPDAASNVQFSLADLGGNDTLVFINLQQTSGPAVNCSSPSVGSTGVVQCTVGSLASGAVATWSASYQIPLLASSGIFYASQAVVSTSTTDVNSENDASVSGFLSALSDIAVQITAAPSVRYDSDYTTTITLSNHGPDASTNTSWNFVLPEGTTFVSLTQNNTPTAACSTPSVGAPGRIQCLWTSLPSQTQVQFTLVLHAITASSIASTALGASDSYDDVLSNNTNQVLSAMTDVPVQLQAIPTLNEWLMLLLAALVAGIGLRPSRTRITRS